MGNWKYSLFVLMGAICFGVLSTIVKRAYAAGFTVNEVIGAQYLFGWLLLLVAFLFSSKKTLTLKQSLTLLTIGFSTSLTGIFYGISLESTPAAIAIVLLFQFTWIGIIIEAFVKKEFPTIDKWLATAIILIGTIFASGLIGQFNWEPNSRGITFGLLAAITFALFIYVSGHVGVGLPQVQRSLLLITGGMLMVMYVLSPAFLFNGSIQTGLWKYGLLLGIVGTLIPVILFGIGTPKIGSGIATILGAAELPAAVLAASFILNEQVTPFMWLGVCLILVGIALPRLINPYRRKELYVKGYE
ncbi:EamA family transporter [Salirhabdus salicampi]|uniref:EamA family transporter n=1 Tax=Salirhabdus salicampi TaxID=476102 RepID=UPI0020C3BEBD|nr:DMT family transporter [Salirhabdus salicampi]MCP8615785.1 DMT family transporter [Salirhabdus salicampi]